MRTLIGLAMLLLAGTATLDAQTRSERNSRPVELAGTWQAETPDGPQSVVVRADSTASFGEETVRWRAQADTIFIQFGDEWVGYNFVLRGDSLTLSGGDLEEPVSLLRIGPAPRAEGGGRR